MFTNIINVKLKVLKIIVQDPQTNIRIKKIFPYRISAPSAVTGRRMGEKTPLLYEKCHGDNKTMLLKILTLIEDEKSLAKLADLNHTLRILWIFYKKSFHFKVTKRNGQSAAP